MKKTNQDILEMLKKFIGPKSINKYDVDLQQGLILARSQEEQTYMKEIEQNCFKHTQSKKVICIYCTDIQKSQLKRPNKYVLSLRFC